MLGQHNRRAAVRSTEKETKGGRKKNLSRNLQGEVTVDKVQGSARSVGLTDREKRKRGKVKAGEEKPRIKGKLE